VVAATGTGVGPYVPPRGPRPHGDGRIVPVCNDSTIRPMTKQGCLWFRVLAAAWLLGLGGCVGPANSPAADPAPSAAPAAPPPAAPASPPPAVEPAPPAPEPAAPPAGPMSTAELQLVLTTLGYKPGPIDGKPGPRTRDALKQFQKDAGLPVTGVLDAETTQRLRAAPPPR
jgi:hypothetical protein